MRLSHPMRSGLHVAGATESVGFKTFLLNVRLLERFLENVKT
jgi:hypothetical protein